MESWLVSRLADVSDASGAPKLEQLLLIPLAFGALSLPHLTLLALLRLHSRSKESGGAASTSDDPASEDPASEEGVGKVAESGGWFGIALRALRLVGTLAFTGLSLAQVFAVAARTLNRAPILATVIYAYASLLAALSLFASRRWQRVSDAHLGAILFAVVCVYTYVDLRPLAVIGELPSRKSVIVGNAIHLASLLVIGVVVPLAIPGPQSSNIVESASLGSYLTWSYFTPIIWYAARHDHLPPEKLPPLSPDDEVNHLVQKDFPKIDPVLLKRKRHVIWSLLDIFKWDYALVTLMVLLEAGSTFFVPIGINQILKHLEDPTASRVRPWVWVIWMGATPMVWVMLAEWYVFVSTKMTVRAEAIVTQLVFVHALRIRLKGEEDAEKKEGDGAKDKGKGKDAAAAPASAEASTSGGESATETETETGTETESTTVAESDTERSPSPTASTATATPSEADLSKDKKDGAKSDEKKSAKQIVGKINNLVTSDLSSLSQARDWPYLIEAVVATFGSVFFLYNLLGWSAFVGIAVIVAGLPIPTWISKLTLASGKKKMEASDKRVQGVNQFMGVVRMIKLFAWENRSLEKLEKLRDEELVWVQWSATLFLLTNTVTQILPLLNILATFGVYTLIMKQELTASRIFTSISVFNIMKGQIQSLTFMLPMIISAKVSLDRISEFLNDSELIDPTAESNVTNELYEQALANRDEDDRIGFSDATFTWETRGPGAEPRVADPKKRDFRLRIEGELLFEKDAINLVIGPTGSGKTSVLLALLGEMYYHPNNEQSWYNLPRGGGVAYAAQETWVLNETIRENIVFGSPFDEERYQKVLEQCALVQDLNMFAAGDKTEVGEKGLTLSGGQKARVTLARAIYSKAEVVLLDDVLAALDVHTARHVVEKCLKGELLRDRTVLLVTHNLALARSIARKVIRVDGQGRVTAEASLAQAIEHDTALRVEFTKEEKLVEKSEAVAEAEGTEEDKDKKDDSPAGKLIMAEEIAHGNVSMAAFMLYLRNLGGPSFWISRAILLVFSSLLKLYLPYYLGLWSNQYEHHNASEVPAAKYLIGYALLALVETGAGLVAAIFWLRAAIRASKIIHRLLITSIFSSTFRWLDTVPVARVIARCTQDLQTVDNALRQIYAVEQVMIVNAIFRIFSIMYVVGWSACVAGFSIFTVSLGIGRFYIQAQRSVKREHSVAKAPILSLFGAGIAGLTSIRAYGAQRHFSKQLSARINRYTMLNRNFADMDRWMGVRMDGLSNIFCAAVAFAVVYGRLIGAGNAGYALSQVLGFAGEIFVIVRMANNAELASNCLERILDFLNIEHEPTPTKEGIPPAYWPASGALHAEKLSARYAVDSPEVLREVTFDIKSGERVGVVGRTGAGKSTITLALLRGILTGGQVLYDGIDIHNINLDALRANITLIPQHPDLLSGSLRDNLDPFGEHDDATLNDALRSAGLFRLQKEGDPAAITLDSEVESGGSNFSHGQRQIIALARAYVRKSKLMIMDEATAAIDYETDAAIQESIRTNLGSDITIITIAHRLQTIMDSDKIMVLDSGRLVEFGTPKELLSQKKGLFFELVERSHDKEVLYGMVKA
ncbi:P-loop containing nucleoside triphosphate hydrolase protein [Punctularia strigosozonata HHB-11173 SS5]|uniref:P-loop containing nucleoside triphosphate hydrolase protein n=1 Tax=Punctularia strigosozonata (strain HHB-11173) TaxID=741275 RepID=UPI0004416D94|nr:P-loop containing nucleoside triphosphate hydrolase protein [Punctularia strigosozonata HHB-11173 SS5]EIN07961.1 P-loop containing nucleoside triphosphate hydrolase protein [Punctularia strigosozonata HHB-11173 SS5]